MRVLDIEETQAVAGGNDVGRDLAQGAGSIVGGVIGGRFGGAAGATGGATAGSIIGGEAYDAAMNLGEYFSNIPTSV
ncbi:hypothetical protein ACJ7V3_12015 [Halomonas elongata]|uniref:hypothetical protein n=1 Tax=Halomonas elongata TaxID=2746 RepID=UPI0038D40184